MSTNDDDFFGLGKPPVEPTADVRNGMAGLFEMYTAAIGAGFNPVQAMQVVLTFLAKS